MQHFSSVAALFPLSVDRRKLLNISVILAESRYLTNPPAKQPPARRSRAPGDLARCRLPAATARGGLQRRPGPNRTHSAGDPHFPPDSATHV